MKKQTVLRVYMSALIVLLLAVIGNIIAVYSYGKINTSQFILVELLFGALLIAIIYFGYLSWYPPKEINTMDELIDILSKVIVKHEKCKDEQLPSFSKKRLEIEADHILDWIDSDKTLTPIHYGCGLFSACLNSVQKQGYLITPSFFMELGYYNRAEELSKVNWY